MYAILYTRLVDMLIASKITVHTGDREKIEVCYVAGASKPVEKHDRLS